MEMKKCKECGKLFLPKSLRQQYCDAIHYRPCPICGKPVIAKYLSDPARRCEDCKGKKDSSKSPKIRESRLFQRAKLFNIPQINKDEDIIEFSEDMISTDDFLSGSVTARYRGPKLSGWIPGNTYHISIDVTEYGYSVLSELEQDDTIKKLYLPLSSMISVNQYFQKVKGENIA